MESIRVVMLRNWHFDILNFGHWQIAWDLWLNSWVISEPKEWAFVLIIISFIPLWFTGWIALSLISWGKVAYFILTLPWKLFKNFFYKPVKIITTNTGVTPIKKKKSYKEIRPRALRVPAGERGEMATSPISISSITPGLSTPRMGMSSKPSLTASNKPAPKNFEHALFKFDDNFDDLDFDIDSFEVEPGRKNSEKNRPTPEKNNREFEADYEEYTPPSRERKDDDRERPTPTPREDGRGERRDDRRENRRDDKRDDRREPRRDDKREDRREPRRDDGRDDRREPPRREEKRDDRREPRREEKRDERRDDRRENRIDDGRDDRREDSRRSPERASSEPRKERPAPTQAPSSVSSAQVPPRQLSGSCMDIIKQKGYEVVSRVSIKNNTIDYVGVSGDRICLCMLDREPGDWLADEERFNDEEPLWFSESSHRISPVRKIFMAKQALLDKLSDTESDFIVDAFIIVQIGNIINAEDMFEIWDDLNVNVTRIDRGTPKEIKLFARTLQEAEKTIAASKLDKILKLIRSMS